MNAKRSAILLSGLLLLMIGMAWAQRLNSPPPTCPPLEDKLWQDLLPPTAWVRANWNANTSRWEIDCTQIEAPANASVPAYNTASNAVYNATNSLPPRRRSTNSNYVNTNPYKPPPDTNIYTGSNANAANRPANVARPVRSVKREPNTRRPGN